MLVLFSIFAVFFAPSTRAIQSLCENFTEPEPCKIADKIIIQKGDEPLITNYNGTIEISNTTIICTDECGLNQANQTLYRWDNAPECCQFKINSTQSVSINGGTAGRTYIKFSNITIEAGGMIQVDSNAVLDASGMGHKMGPGYSQNTNQGACFAAQSGFCQAQQPDSIDFIYGTYDQTYEDISEANRSLFYGSGTNSTRNDTIGGGSIVLRGGSLQLLGNLTANGMPNTTNASLAGGSGGFIYLGINGTITQDRVIIGFVRANGGNGVISGGSGGRIVIDISPSNYSSNNMFQSRIPINAVGGASNDSGNLCNYGGSGTIYFKNEQRLLVFGQGSSLQSLQFFAKTMIQGKSNSTILVSSEFIQLAIGFFGIESWGSSHIPYKVSQ